jgi:hypothetical protein
MKKFPDKKIYPTRFNGYYVGSNGTIWTHWHINTGYFDKIRRVTEFSRGGSNPNDRYLSVNISLKNDNGKLIRQISYYSHKLIAETLIPNPHNYSELNHKNRNKLDNRIENLEWISREDNMIHLRKTYNDVIVREKLLIEEYIPIIDNIPNDWKIFHKPKKIKLSKPPRFYIKDSLTSKEYYVISMTDWINDNWEVLSKRCNNKNPKNFYASLMSRRKNNKSYYGIKVERIQKGKLEKPWKYRQ